MEAGQDGLITGRGRGGAKQPNFIVGFVTGILAYVGFILGAWHLKEWAAVNFTTIEDFGIIVLGTIITGWIIRSLLKIQGKNVIRNHLLGIIVAFGTFHMAVHAFPEQIEMAFAPEWMAQTMSSTSPDFMTPDAGFLAARDVIMVKLESMETYQNLRAELAEELEN